MEDIKASIIIPVYNVEFQLRRCLDSVLYQKYENIEIILVNDGSTDNSLKICNEYCLKDSRIILINKLNGGLSSARNAGIERASGNIIFFIDSDDWVSDDFCSCTISAFLKHDVDIVIFGFNIVTGKHVRKFVAKKSGLITKEDAINGLLVDKDIRNYAWNKAYKAELFKNIRYPEGKTFEDVATTFKVFDKASSFYIIDKPLYNYEIRVNGISTKWWKSEKKINDYFDVRCEQYDYIKNRLPNLMGNATSSVGFAALMGVSYLEEKERMEKFLVANKKNMLDSAFPVSLFFSLYYRKPLMAVNLLRFFFK